MPDCRDCTCWATVEGAAPTDLSGLAAARGHAAPWLAETVIAGMNSARKLAEGKGHGTWRMPKPSWTGRRADVERRLRKGDLLERSGAGARTSRHHHRQRGEGHGFASAHLGSKPRAVIPRVQGCFGVRSRPDLQGRFQEGSGSLTDAAPARRFAIDRMSGSRRLCGP